jgi:hypothetical protein
MSKYINPRMGVGTTVKGKVGQRPKKPIPPSSRGRLVLSMIKRWLTGWEQP